MSSANQSAVISDLTVDVLIGTVVDDLKHGRLAELVIRDEAEKIVERLKEDNPDALFNWFEQHMVSLIAQNLHVRVARVRQSARRSAFAAYEDPEEEETWERLQRTFGAPSPESPFLRPYACPNNVWKPVGKMTRPDWNHVINNRVQTVGRSLFTIEFAKLVVNRLPDDETKTEEVCTEAELRGFEQRAERQTEELLHDVRP